jgi:NADH:ubiquinone oxidoreductase subunit E
MHQTTAHEPVFTGERKKELEQILERYETRRAGLLPALWMVQHARGWISDEAMAEVADVLGLTPAYVKGVVTFYTMYHQHPVGEHFIQVCTTTCCNVVGAEDVVQAFLEQTGCGELGATSPDGKYTVIEVECLGGGAGKRGPWATRISPIPRKRSSSASTSAIPTPAPTMGG